jgi:hypothetical protein
MCWEDVLYHRMGVQIARVHEEMMGVMVNQEVQD